MKSLKVVLDIVIISLYKVWELIWIFNVDHPELQSLIIEKNVMAEGGFAIMRSSIFVW